MVKGKTIKHTKIIDDNLKMPDREGNGTLKLLASVDEKKHLTRYSLAYINYRLCSEDNGRVLGYDNCHGYHHRHYMGKEEAVEFESFEAIAEKFDKEWRILHEKAKHDHR